MIRRLLTALPFVMLSLLAVLLLVWAYPGGRDSSLLNDGWNGLSGASGELNATALLTYEELAGIELPSTIVLMPRMPVAPVTADDLDRFTSEGGVLVLLDDFGFGNDLLQQLNIDIRLTGGTLVDPLYCHKNGTMPRVKFSFADADRQPGTIVFNRGTWLDVGAGGNIWAWSSYFSFGDSDGDGLRGGGEPVGPLPVAASVNRGAGRIVVVADSSILLNGMGSLEGNLDAVRQWVEGPVFIDQAHLPDAELDGSNRVLGLFRTALGQGGGAVLLAIAAAGCAVEYAWYNRGRRNYD